MKYSLAAFLTAGLMALTPPSAAAEEASLSFGGDQYTAGQHAAIGTPVARDAFIAGYDVTIAAPVENSAHLAGFNVSTSAPVNGDVYAAGFSVGVGGAVGGDVTAGGNSVTIREGAPVTGNARLAGQQVTISAPVGGSALVTAQNLSLNSPVAGDLNFFGETITFGAGASVAGQVIIQAPQEIAVPASVAPADRVSFTQLENVDYVGQASQTAENVVRGFWPAFWAAAAWLLVLVLVGAALIAFMPGLVTRLEVAAAKRPFRNMGLGILAFASTLGLVIVAALTIVGLIAVPFVLLYVFVACSFAYVVGVYLAGKRIATAFVAVDTNLKRLAVLAVSLVLAALLALIPVLGWLITLLLLAFGFGAISVVTMVRWTRGDADRLGSTAGEAAPAPAE